MRGRTQTARSTTTSPSDHVWLDGDGSESGRGTYADDDEAVAYLDTQNVQANENYVFFSQADQELRTIAGAGFIHARPVWQDVSSGTGGVPGPRGNDGADGSDGAQGAQGPAGNDGSTGLPGSQGPIGPDGALGQYTITVYRSAALHPNAAPTGGSVVVATGAVTPPAGWDNEPPTPNPGEFTYGTEYRVDPATQTGTVTPVWGTVYLFSGPRGSRGPDGPMGPDGPAGATGATGAAGADGATGLPGLQGPQGTIIVQIFRNAAAPPPTPTGGSYNIDTGALVVPAGWTDSPTTLGAGHLTYISRVAFDPAVQSGTITPTWSAPFQAGATGRRGSRETRAYRETPDPPEPLAPTALPAHRATPGPPDRTGTTGRRGSTRSRSTGTP